LKRLREESLSLYEEPLRLSCCFFKRSKRCLMRCADLPRVMSGLEIGQGIA
jgi:hypothetical protein